MKKRNFLFAILLAMSMFVTACGSNSQSVEGNWVGKLDVTKQFEDGIKAAYPDLADYVDFEDLVFVLDIALVDGYMTMSVQQDSIDKFNDNFSSGMKALAKGYWAAQLATYDMTIEEDSFESGLTEDEYINRIYATTGIDKMIVAMVDVTNTTLDRISQMEGTYTTLGKELRLWYTEDKYEAMGYSFEGKNLNIVIKGDGFSLLIKCEKNK